MATDKQLRWLIRTAYTLLLIGIVGLFAAVIMGFALAQWSIPRVRSIIPSMVVSDLVIVIGICCLMATKCIRGIDARLTLLEEAAKQR